MLTKLVVKIEGKKSKVTGGSVFATVAPIPFKLKDKRFTIPRGFVTDLATIPKQLNWVFNYDDRELSKAAIIHDYLYFLLRTEDRVSRGFSRKEADLKMAKVVWRRDKWKAIWIYLGLWAGRNILPLFGKDFLQK